MLILGKTRKPKETNESLILKEDKHTLNKQFF